MVGLRRNSTHATSTTEETTLRVKVRVVAALAMWVTDGCCPAEVGVLHSPRQPCRGPLQKLGCVGGV